MSCISGIPAGPGTNKAVHGSWLSPVEPGRASEEKSSFIARAFGLPGSTTLGQFSCVRVPNPQLIKSLRLIRKRQALARRFRPHTPHDLLFAGRRFTAKAQSHGLGNNLLFSGSDGRGRWRWGDVCALAKDEFVVEQSSACKALTEAPADGGGLRAIGQSRFPSMDGQCAKQDTIGAAG